MVDLIRLYAYGFSIYGVGLCEELLWIECHENNVRLVGIIGLDLGELLNQNLFTKVQFTQVR